MCGVCGYVRGACVCVCVCEDVERLRRRRKGEVCVWGGGAGLRVVGAHSRAER